MAKEPSVAPRGIAANRTGPEVVSQDAQPAKRSKARKRAFKAAKPGDGATGAPKRTQRAPTRAGGTKQDKLVALLRRGNGASLAEMMKLTGWQAQSGRGVMSGALKKKLGLEIISEKNETTGERRYYYRSIAHRR